MTPSIASYDTKTITEREYGVFQLAYDFFNAELFNGSLPAVLVTFQRHAKAKGYFAANRFGGREDEAATAHELAMNPDVFTGRSDEGILSTLVHEMAHVWQQTHGTPPRKAYHDKQWAAKMKEIGLQPTTTGDSTGKETGQKVTHFIIPGARYAQAYAKLAATGFRLNWQSLPFAADRKKKAASKTKYTCPTCQTNAWAKPNTALICGTCYDEDEGEITMMYAEEPETEQ
jgi:predicted SprT family Zn-dependent metalloprotease